MSIDKEFLYRFDTAIKHAEISISDMVPEVIENILEHNFEQAMDLLMELEKCETFIECIKEVRHLLDIKE